MTVLILRSTPELRAAVMAHGPHGLLVVPDRLNEAPVDDEAFVAEVLEHMSRLIEGPAS